MFKKAVRSQAKLKLAITGPSGSGKTFSALRLAKGMGGRIAVVDTENGSASLYSDRFDFDALEMYPPFSTEKYIQAIQGAEKAGYEILIIDSLSHQWAGEGGLLNKKEQMDSRGGNSYINWAKMTPEHEKFKSAILHCNMHVIGTIRSKQDYVLEQNEKGKQVPRKVGLAPIQRDSMEYEFTTVFDISMNHEASASKDRTGLFVDRMFQMTEDTGKDLMAWLMSAAPKIEPPVVSTIPKVTREQALELVSLLKEAGESKEDMESHLKSYKIDKVVDCNLKIYGELRDYFQTKITYLKKAQLDAEAAFGAFDKENARPT